MEFPEEMAGRQVQCPSCGRLVDIPSTDELSHLSDDGTFLIGEPVQADPHVFDELRRVYAKRKVDENGQDVDLRQTPEQLAAAGTEDDVFEYERLPKAPKYDPETGELIRPLDMVEEPAPAARHVAEAAPATLNYATPDFQDPLSYSPLARLFAPVNLITMFFVFLLHMFLYMTAFSLYLSIAAIFVVGPALIGHYANVIEEIGVEDRDELPRLLRHFDLTDDIFRPFAHVFVAWAICFAPTWLLWLVWIYHQWPLEGGVITASVLLAIGWIFFPAVVLTTTTSGAYANLRPDRIMAVIGKIGPRYALLVVIYVIACALYLTGLVAVPAIALAFAFSTQVHNFGYIEPSAIGILIVGIFLMHYFAWRLGICYRRLHQKFPWVYHQIDRVLPGVNAPRYSKPQRAMAARARSRQG